MASLWGGTTTVFYTGATGGTFTTTVNWPEVGIIDLNLASNNPAGYLGTGFTYAHTLANVGRFVPDHYHIDPLSIDYVDREDLLSCVAPGFTYMDEPIGITFNIEARNAQDAITRYYMGDFAKLDNAAELGIGAVDGTLDLTARITPTVTITWGSVLNTDTGEGEVMGTVILTKDASNQNVEDGPYRDFQIGVLPNDNDHLINGMNNGNTIDNTLDMDAVIGAGTDLLEIANTDILYGRLVLNPAFGSEVSDSAVAGVGNDVAVTLEIEYWDGDKWVISTGDECSIYNSSALDFVPNTFVETVVTATETLTVSRVDAKDADVQSMPGDGAVDIGQSSTSSTDIDNGIPMYVSAPNTSDDLSPIDGLSALLELDLDALGLGYLKYNWRGTTPADPFDEAPDASGVQDNPRAPIDFGTFQGHNRVINWQELFLDR